jgi:putative resolvase
MEKATRLSQWAKNNGYSYSGAYKAYKRGDIKGAYAISSGSVLVKEEVENKSEKIATYARVSSPKQKEDLKRQSERLVSFCIANGWIVSHVFEEVASGLNDNRKLFNKILDDQEITKIVVEHKDRLSRFGFNYISRLLKQQKRNIVVINESASDGDDLMQDFVSIITSMTARLYGLRRTKRKTEELINRLSSDE